MDMQTPHGETNSGMRWKLCCKMNIVNLFINDKLDKPDDAIALSGFFDYKMVLQMM